MSGQMPGLELRVRTDTESCAILKVDDQHTPVTHVDRSDRLSGPVQRRGSRRSVRLEQRHGHPEPAEQQRHCPRLLGTRHPGHQPAPRAASSRPRSTLHASCCGVLRTAASAALRANSSRTMADGSAGPAERRRHVRWGWTDGRASHSRHATPAKSVPLTSNVDINDYRQRCQPAVMCDMCKRGVRAFTWTAWRASAEVLRRRTGQRAR